MKRRVSSIEGPDPIDVHVGARLRNRRIMLGMSQTDVGHRLGVSFQQVQKYERGVNRLSASQLWRAAETLKVELTFFFSGLAREAPPIEPAALTLRHAEIVRAIDKMPASTQEAFARLAAALVAEET